MKVKQLDRHLVNKIAAGEVIERPASVVKELVENSIDAKSSMVEVTVSKGGLDHIFVSDDGEGMSPEDLELAIRRHTTSKISREEDLENIITLGFRGEALASIVEVSKTAIITRGEESEEATLLEIEGGEITRTRAEGRRPGTTVKVQDLFFNTPARRKYLRKEKTEAYHINRIVKRFILSNPQVHFRLYHDERKVIDSPPSGDLREVIADLYDAQLARSLIGVNSAGSRIKVSGFVSRPDLTRSDRSEQFVFVNGRYVKDNAINYAISRAFEGMIKRARFPLIFLFIEIDPQMVDVNVHPKKEEVRFSNQVLVQQQVKKAIQDGLFSQQVVPHLEEEKAARRQEFRYRREGAFYEEGLEEVQPQLDLRQELLKKKEVEEETKGFRTIGQIHDSYIILETKDGFEIIDQHIAHERVLYEQLLDQIMDGEIKRQRLLIPITIELPPDKAHILEGNLELLDEKLGIGIEGFGGGTFILRDWPQVLADKLSKEGFKDSIDKILAALKEEAKVEFEELVKKIAAEMACAGAIVANTPLKREEMQDLVKKLKGTKNPYSCPHGRPIIVKYLLDDLERKFGRG